MGSGVVVAVLYILLVFEFRFKEGFLFLWFLFGKSFGIRVWLSYWGFDVLVFMLVVYI